MPIRGFAGGYQHALTSSCLPSAVFALRITFHARSAKLEWVWLFFWMNGWYGMPGIRGGVLLYRSVPVRQPISSLCFFVSWIRNTQIALPTQSHQGVELRCAHCTTPAPVFCKDMVSLQKKAHRSLGNLLGSMRCISFVGLLLREGRNDRQNKVCL
jgi:hypothetical protein